MKNCCEFCIEFSEPNSEERAFFHSLFPHLTNRILLETENFIVIPTLGHIIEGYLLIITKEHYLSFANLPFESHPELDWLIEQSSHILQDVYGKNCIFFEHGPVSTSQKGSCCIDHAHLHVVPTDVDITPDIIQIQREKYKIDNYPVAANDSAINEKPYIYINVPDGSDRSLILLDATDLPKQYIRRVLAKAIGKPDEWHWAYFLYEENMEKCFKKLKPQFAQLKPYTRHYRK